MPGIANLLRRIWPRVFGTTVKPSYGSSGLESGTLWQQVWQSGFPKKDHFEDHCFSVLTGRSTAPGNITTRSDKLELTPPTAYKHHENYTRYSEETEHEDRNYGYQG